MYLSLHYHHHNARSEKFQEIYFYDGQILCDRKRTLSVAYGMRIADLMLVYI